MGAFQFCFFLVCFLALGGGLAFLRVDLRDLGFQLRYELKSMIAADAVAYAMQQRHAARKANPTLLWNAHNMRQAGLGYAKLQVQGLSMPWTLTLENEMGALIEAHVAYEDARASGRETKVKPHPSLTR